MKLSFEIDDKKLKALSPGAKEALTKHGNSFIEEIVDEASRIEASRRSPTTNIEITAAIIDDAATYSKRLPLKRGVSLASRITQIFASLSSMLAGWLMDVDSFKSTGVIFAFVIVVMIAVTTTVIPIINGRGNGN